MGNFENIDNIEGIQGHTIFRVYGGNSSLEGGYITNERPVNPIQAREDLALSQHDFTDENGNITRNLANTVAEGTIYTDENGNIYNSDAELTNHTLTFNTVNPQSDLPGGGQECILEDSFSDVVCLNNVEDLKHHSTPGWEEYIDAEDKVINEVNLKEEEDMNDFDTNETIDETVDTISLDTLIENDEYEIQREDTNGKEYGKTWEESWYSTDSEDDIDTIPVDELLDDEEYNIQNDDTDTIYDENGWNQ